MALQIDKVTENVTSLNIMIYGESGVGKTVLAGSSDEVPQMRNVLFIDVEGGTSSLVHTYPNVDTVRVKTFDDLYDVYNAFYHQSTDIMKYNTIVIDSLTEVQKFSMYGIMDKLLKDKPDRDPDVPSQREWGINLEQVRRLVRGFRDLPVNAIFTALVKETKDDLTGQVTMTPSLTGKMAGEVAAFLDIVCYLYVKDTKKGDDIIRQRMLLTQKTDRYVAKDRSGKLPLIVEAPTMKKLYEMLKLSNSKTK